MYEEHYKTHINILVYCFDIFNHFVTELSTVNSAYNGST